MDRYYSDRTFLICLYIVSMSGVLCAFGRIDGTTFGLVAVTVISGWITKRTAEEIKRPELVRANTEAGEK